MKKIWLRIGDGGEYESFGQDFDAVASALSDCGVGKSVHQIDKGLASAAFVPQDHISLFWGDDVGNHCFDLTRGEFEQIRGRLN